MSYTLSASRDGSFSAQGTPQGCSLSKGEYLCNLCPRECLVDRSKALGLCGAGNELVISKYMIHKWEEPCLVCGEGSGAIFFSGCNLRCVYCQNKEISAQMNGEAISPFRLGEIMLELQDKGVSNINLVTPSHFSDKIRQALDLIRGKLKIPVVYNTSGYEKPEEIAKMAGYVSIFLTDVKYFDSELSKKYSHASNYFEYAISSLKKMLELEPRAVFDEKGTMQRGVIVRHLCLPSHRADSIKILNVLARELDVNSFKLSLMSQYTPEFCPMEYKELKRKITTFEYESVVNEAIKLGFDGFIQDKSSASSKFTPKF